MDDAVENGDVDDGAVDDADEEDFPYSAGDGADPVFVSVDLVGFGFDFYSFGNEPPPFLESSEHGDEKEPDACEPSDDGVFPEAACRGFKAEEGLENGYVFLGFCWRGFCCYCWDEEQEC